MLSHLVMASLFQVERSQKMTMMTGAFFQLPDDLPIQREQPTLMESLCCANRFSTELGLCLFRLARKTWFISWDSRSFKHEHPCWEELLPMIKRNQKKLLQTLLLWPYVINHHQVIAILMGGLRSHPQWSVYGSQGCPHSSVSLCFLVLWNMAFIRFYGFPILSHHIGNVILPTDELTPSFFRGVAQPPTRLLTITNHIISININHD